MDPLRNMVVELLLVTCQAPPICEFQMRPDCIFACYIYIQTIALHVLKVPAIGAKQMLTLRILRGGGREPSLLISYSSDDVREARSKRCHEAYRTKKGQVCNDENLNPGQQSHADDNMPS